MYFHFTCIFATCRFSLSFLFFVLVFFLTVLTAPSHEVNTEEQMTRNQRKMSKWCYTSAMLTKSHEFKVTVFSLEILKDAVFFPLESHLEVYL